MPSIKTAIVCRLFRRIGLMVALSLIGAQWHGIAFAQDYPSKPLRLIVPFPAGGTPDIVGRILGQSLSQALGRPVVVENRPGAGGTVGTEAGARSPADGYTLILGTTGTLASAPGLYSSLAYEPTKSFAPISLLASTPLVIAVNPSMGSTVKEFIALAKAKPGVYNFASFGSGGAPHIAGEMLKATAGIELTHVPYKVMANAVTDLVTGRIHVMVNQVSQFQAHVQTGKLRALAIAGPSRIGQLPDVPTAAEAGLPNYEVLVWFGLLAPAGTPSEIVGKLNAVVLGALASKQVQEGLSAQGFEPTGSAPEEFSAFIARETNKWSRAIKDSGAKLD